MYVYLYIYMYVDIYMYVCTSVTRAEGALPCLLSLPPLTSRKTSNIPLKATKVSDDDDNNGDDNDGDDDDDNDDDNDGDDYDEGILMMMMFS
jgi:hypothetical protein